MWASFTTVDHRDLTARLAQRPAPGGPCVEPPKPRRGERLTLADGVDVEIRPVERSDRELPDTEGAVDVAVTVGDPWQGRGLGTALLARVIERARDEGHLAVQATVLAENTASIAMLRRAGFASRSGAGAMRELELELAFTEPRGPQNP